MILLQQHLSFKLEACWLADGHGGLAINERDGECRCALESPFVASVRRRPSPRRSTLSGLTFSTPVPDSSSSDGRHDPTRTSLRNSQPHVPIRYTVPTQLFPGRKGVGAPQPKTSFRSHRCAERRFREIVAKKRLANKRQATTVHPFATLQNRELAQLTS